MIHVQLLVSPDCTHCDEVKAILKRVQADQPDMLVEEIDAMSPRGLQLSIDYGILVMPGLIVNGRFLAMGSITEAMLRRELTAA